MCRARGNLGWNSERHGRSGPGLLASALFVAGSSLMLLVGCNSPPPFEFDELDLVPAQEELTEFSLGEYLIPVPVVDDRADNQPAHRNRYQLEFELFALISPHAMSQIANAWDRHEGKIRDRVIRICRNCSLDELQEPELATLKGKLLDALAPHLGEKEVRQLLITEIESQKITDTKAGHAPVAKQASAH